MAGRGATLCNRVCKRFLRIPKIPQDVDFEQRESLSLPVNDRNMALMKTEMKLYARSILITVALLVTVCVCSCSHGGLSGKEFRGSYQPAEIISLKFDDDSTATAHIYSTDYAGHFSDCFYGKYEYRHPYITIEWQRVDPDNEKYRHVILNPDSVMVNEALDTIYLYEGNRKEILPNAGFYHIEDNASLGEKMGQYCYQTLLLIIVFTIDHFIPLLAIAILLFLAVRWWKKKR
ncbi:MAG: hypothetical protein IJV05_09990 [Muribaculaceae bacterium]|nr:hypothetical protein [Muribaculaceae bacterium]